MALLKIQKLIRALADDDKKESQKRFFKMGPGDYGFGDQFLGVGAPKLRQIARAHQDSSYATIKQLIYSVYHEERLLAVLILVVKYQMATNIEKVKVYEFYLKHAKKVNNWDLVDASAPAIVGCHLYRKNVAPLMGLAKSNILWERRIAIVATLYFIQHHYFNPTIRIAAMLLKDQEPLIHKATGWMLREIAKRDKALVLNFIETHYAQIPRVTLRYSIERFAEPERKKYLNWGAK